MLDRPSRMMTGSLPLAVPSVLKMYSEAQNYSGMPHPHGSSLKSKLLVQEFSFFYGPAQALFKIDIDIPEHHVTAFIGPSGCGKSTLLRCMNRLNDLIEGARHGAGRTTPGGVVKLGEAQPVIRQPVEVRGVDFAAVAADVGIAHVIGHDEHDIGPPRRPGPGQAQAKNGDDGQ